MPFKKGNKHGKGGKRPGAGALTKEEKLLRLERQNEKETFQQALIRLREEYGTILARRYYEFSLDDPATMRHAVERILPPAKQQIELEGSLTVIHKTNIPEKKEE